MAAIHKIAAKLGLGPEDLELYGSHIAKLKPPVRERIQQSPAGRLVLVSAITPTPAGEGKTTTAIGLAQGLAQLGESVCLALREPSLGPCFGKKGGGTGGGKCQVLPADRINLHFTGDFHAVTAAHNLLAAMVDNHIYFDNPLRVDPRRIVWRRVIDVNDRALREMVIGLGGRLKGVPREAGFDITAASELMAMLCLAENAEDLRTRIDRTLIAFTYDGRPVTAKSLAATGALLALLRDALMPNLVETSEGIPALIHGGPFANIAHGCNSVMATKAAMHLADWAVTEAGFGFDLGAEKFFDIKCRTAGIDTAAVVLVATARALKLHGGKKLADLDDPDPAAVERGLSNLDKHVENIRCFCKTPIVALNRFAQDTDEEIMIVRRRCDALGVAFAETDHFVRGGAAPRRSPRPLWTMRNWRAPRSDPCTMSPTWSPIRSEPWPQRCMAPKTFTSPRRRPVISKRSSDSDTLSFPSASRRRRTHSRTIRNYVADQRNSRSPSRKSESTRVLAFWLC